MPLGAELDLSADKISADFTRVLNEASLFQSIGLAGLVTLLSVVSGLATALIALQLPARARRVLVATAAVALCLPPFTVASAWMDLLGPSKPWRAWFPFQVFSLPSAVLLLSFLYWPIVFFIGYGNWRALNRGLLEIDPHARGVKLLCHALLPASRTAITLSAVVVFTLALNQFSIPSLLQVRVLTAEMWIRYSTNLDAKAALLSACPLVVISCLLYGLLRPRWVTWPMTEFEVEPRNWRHWIGTPLTAISVVIVAVNMLSWLVPLSQVLGSTRAWSQLEAATRAGFNAMLHSGIQAFATASLVMGFAALFSIAPSQAGVRKGPTLAVATTGALSCLRFGAWFLFWMPGIFLGIAFIQLNSGASFSGGCVWLAGLCIKYLAIGWFGLQRAMERADRNVMDAARLEGFNKFALLRHVIWLQSKSLLLVTWYIIYLLVLWDVELGILLQPPGGETLALRIFNLLHYGHNDQVHSLSIQLLILAITPLVVFALISMRRGAALCVLLLPAILVGCRDSNSASDSLALDTSKLFSQARILGHRGTGGGDFNKPRSIAIGLTNEVYVSDMTGRIQRLNSEGQIMNLWQMPQIDKGKPKGMTTDAEGMLWVVEPHYQRVNQFEGTGKLLRQWGRSGTGAGDLILPRSIAINSKGIVLLPEYTVVDRIQAFSATNGSWLFTIGHAGDKPGEFNRPEGIAVDRDDHIYVADSCNHRIQILDAEGKFLRMYGKAGSSAGEFSYPYDIKVDAEGRQYVCEFGNSRIQIFDAQDRWIETLGGHGSGPGQLNNPWSIALNAGGDLYVADSGNHRVVKFRRKSASVQKGGKS